MTTNIFISHNKADKDFVRRLADDLDRAGIKVWVDEANIRIGDTLIEKIKDGMEGSHYLGVVLTPNSVVSEWVKDELDLAQKMSVKILPLLYKACDIPSLLEGKLFSDFTDANRYEIELRQLLSSLVSSFVGAAFVSRTDLQYLLDKLPIPKQRESYLVGSAHDDMNHISTNSIDLSELISLVSWPKQKVIATLRELISENKAELFFIMGEIENDDHPTIPAGSKFKLPMIYRGLLPPEFRPNSEEVVQLFRDLEVS